MKKLCLNLFLSFAICLCSVSVHKMLIPDNTLDPLSKNSSLIEIAKNINSANKKILTLDDISLSNETLKSTLPNTVEELQSIKDLLDNSNEIISNKPNLLDGLSNNILFYNQLLAILNNPKGSDISNSLDSLMSYGETTSSCYKTLYPINISFADNGKIFMKNFEDGIYEEISTLQAKSTNIKNNKDFLNIFENTTSSFFKVNKNYIALIEKCRTNHLEFKEVLSDLDKTSKIVDSLGMDLYSITAPSNGSAVFSSFSKIVDSYSLYLKSIRQSLYSEMFASKILDSNDIDELYSVSNEEYEKLESYMATFSELFNNYKDNINN